MKIKYILTILSILIFTEIPVHSNTYAESSKSENYTENIQKGRKTKDGRYKRKKGFMWGLFGKKKECDCPKN